MAGLKEWFKQDWVDIGSKKKGGSVKQAVKTITSPKTILRNIKSKRKFGGGKK